MLPIGEGEGRRAGRPAPRIRAAAVGALGEELAAAHMRRLGFAVIARNVRTPRGEIDLIAVRPANARVRRGQDPPCAGRASAGAATGEPLVWLRASQRARIRRSASAWLAEAASRPRARVLRFDAIGVLVDRRGRLLRLDHLEGAW